MDSLTFITLLGVLYFAIIGSGLAIHTLNRRIPMIYDHIVGLFQKRRRNIQHESNTEIIVRAPWLERLERVMTMLTKWISVTLLLIISVVTVIASWIVNKLTISNLTKLTRLVTTFKPKQATAQWIIRWAWKHINKKGE